MRWTTSVGLTAFLLAAASPVVAQDVTYKTHTKASWAGALGKLINAFGGDSETTETTFYKGARTRTDLDKQSNIVDFDQGRMVSIDHQRKAYTEFTFADLANMTANIAQSAQANAAAADVPTVRTDKEQVDFTFDFRIERTGEKKTIAGAPSERVFLTMITDMEYTEEGSTQKQEAGKIAMLMDMWVSKDTPIYEAQQAFSSAAAKGFGQTQQLNGAAMAYAQDPRFAAAMEKMGEEARKLDGVAMFTVTTLAIVPPGQEFDRKLITDPAEKPKSSAASTAAKGLLRGMLGARQEESRAEEAPRQTTLLTTTSEITEVKTGAVAEDLFVVPAGYRKMEFGAGG